jgi:4,5-dihydroxyphthalate decarboxylase
MLRSRGDDTFIAIPVFPSRLFRHSCIYVNRKAGINKPSDLIGRRIGVPEYSMTAAVFARGLLLHEYGVKPETIEWFSGTQDGLQRPTRIDFELPGVTLTRMPLEQDMGPMLETGEIDAIISPNAPKALGRPDSRCAGSSRTTARSRRTTSRRPASFRSCTRSCCGRMSTKSIPGPPRALFEAFEQAKRWAYDQLMETDALKLTLPWVVAETEETRRIMGEDFWPYGVGRESTRARGVAAILVRAALCAARRAD